MHDKGGADNSMEHPIGGTIRAKGITYDVQPTVLTQSGYEALCRAMQGLRTVMAFEAMQAAYALPEGSETQNNCKMLMIDSAREGARVDPPDTRELAKWIATVPQVQAAMLFHCSEQVGSLEIAGKIVDSYPDKRELAEALLDASGLRAVKNSEPPENTGESGG